MVEDINYVFGLYYVVGYYIPRCCGEIKDGKQPTGTRKRGQRTSVATCDTNHYLYRIVSTSKYDRCTDSGSIASAVAAVGALTS